HHVRNAFHAAVPGDSNGRQGQRMTQGCVNGDETLNTAVRENLRIIFKELWIMTVSNCQKDEVLLAQISFNAADDRRAVKIADFLHDYTDHVGSFYSQVASVEAGPIFQLAGGREDALFCGLGNRPGCNRIV